MSRLADLLTRWRQDAAVLRTWGAEDRALILERAVAQLEAEQAAEADELLTLDAAAAESGFSSESIRKWLAQGTIPNAGRKHAPRVRRADLPKRPPREGASTPASTYDPDADALALLRARRRA